MGLFHSIFGLPQPARQNNISGSGHTTHSSGTATPSLVKGTVVKGEVIDLRSNQVTVRLDDGSTLHAKLSTAMDLAIGQRADFFVQETNDVLITLKLLSDGDASFTEAVIDKALEAAGFPKSAHNADIVRALLDAGLPAGKEMIQRMMQHSAANSGVELSTLTALIKHNLPVTKENAAGLQTYRNFEHRLAEQASSLAASLTEALTDSTLSPSLSKQFFSEFFSRAESNSGTMPFSPETFSSDTILTTNASGSDDTIVSVSPEMTEPPGQATSASGTATVLNTLTASQAPTVTTSQPQGEVPLPLSEEGYRMLSDIMEQLPADSPEAAYLSSHIETKTLAATGLFTALSSLAQKDQHAPLLSLIKDVPEFTGLLQAAVTDGFLMTPEDLTQEHFIGQFYEKLTSKLRVLQELTEAGGDSPALKSASNTVKNMQDNLQFMNTLNQVFPYVQLPLTLSGKATHGELYVYTKKKDLSAKDKEVSILLHLDMDALGPTDIHLSMLQKNVSASFYLSDDDALALVTGQMPDLTERLQQKGYAFRATTEKRTKEPDIVADFMDGGESVSMKRFRFDIRA